MAASAMSGNGRDGDPVAYRGAADCSCQAAGQGRYESGLGRSLVRTDRIEAPDSSDIEKLRNCRHQLRRGKWLCQENAVRNTLHRPLIVRRAADIDDRERRINLASDTRHPPTVYSSQQNDIRDEGAVL